MPWPESTKHIETLKVLGLKLRRLGFRGLSVPGFSGGGGEWLRADLCTVRVKGSELRAYFGARGFESEAAQSEA